MQNMQRLLEYVSKHKEGKWTSVPKRADSIGCRNISLHFQDKSHLALLGLISRMRASHLINCEDSCSHRKQLLY
ncbi:Homeodomain-like [Trema orientale]|uniref:Homeodomain-like n=1 Tax=Trema orientale TaxID=63057 RepID=A0A2P5F671_TREOI|nr:Homeodomain-like [Trema orientale]